MHHQQFFFKVPLFLLNMILQTKVDFTMMGGMLLCVLVVFMLFGLVAIFLPQSRSLLKLFCRQLVSRTLHMVWGALGALIFSVYLVYDTQVSHLKDHTFIIPILQPVLKSVQ